MSIPSVSVSTAAEATAPDDTRQASASKLRVRYVDIDAMKGIAITLVVVGHVVASRSYPRGNEWYWYLQYWIYHFHMPLFMYLAGLTFFLFQKPVSDLRGYRAFLLQKASRLLPALFVLGALVVVAKAVLSGWVHVDHPVRDFWSDLLKLFYDPLGSALVSVWFVYTLFVIYAIVVPLLLVAKWRPEFIVLIGVIAYFLPLTDYFCLSRVGEYLVMFGLGCAAAPYYTRIVSITTRYFPAFLCLFVALSALDFIFMNGLSEDLKKTTLSLASVPVAHAIASKMTGRSGKAFALLGMCSLIIYLLNIEFMGTAKALLLKLHSWDGEAFLIFFPVLALAGTLGPVLLKRKIFVHYRLLDRLTG